MAKNRVLLIMAFLTVSAVQAQATPWRQAFREAEMSKFNEINIFMVSGDESFFGPVRFGNPSWSLTDGEGFLSATGNLVRNLKIGLGFSGKDPFSFDLFTIRGEGITEKIIGGTTYAWSGSSWSIDEMSRQEARMAYKHDMLAAAPVPEPTTSLLFALGLTGLAAVGRRRKA